MNFNQSPQDPKENRRARNFKQVIIYWFISSVILFGLLYLIFRALFN